MRLMRASNGLTNPMTAIGYDSACTLSHLRHQTSLQTGSFHRTADL